MIETQDALESKIKEWGFMPFFKSAVEGFPVEDIMPDDLLFGEKGNADEYGAWQWRGDIISHWQLAYGKFFAGKAGYVSLEWLPDFMNMRRKAYPMSKYEADNRRILSTLIEHESMLSRELKKASGFTLSRKRKTFDPQNPTESVINKRNGTSFDAQIAQLQMGTYVCIADFEYNISKEGKPYGWGVARYCTPEAMYELGYKALVKGRTPKQSRERILAHLRTLFLDATDKQWSKVI